MFKALGLLGALIRGVWITARHFLVNLFFHSLLLFGIKAKRGQRTGRAWELSQFVLVG